MSDEVWFMGPAAAKSQGGKILLADDEEGITRVLTNMFAHLGYEISSAADGQEVLDRTREFLPDLIILDLGLPKLDGFEVCRTLRSDARTSTTAIIVLTAFASESDRRKALEAGADAFVTKPFSPMALLDKVRELISARPLSRASPTGNEAEGQVVRCTFDRMSRQQLENYAGELGELYQRTAALLEELKQENQERRQFLAVLCHELGTPLTPIMSSLSLLGEVLSPDPQGPAGRLMASMKAGAETLMARIDDLRDIAAFRAGAYQLEIREVDTPVALREMASPLEADALQRQHKLVLDIPEGLPPVGMDVTLIRRVMSNLLINAMEFSPEGVSIKLRAWFGDGCLHLSVMHSGKGMSLEQQSLFQPYCHSEQDRHHFSRMGLRVALCREIVNAHGGKMWAQTGVELGNSFHFSLPSRGWGT